MKIILQKRRLASPFTSVHFGEIDGVRRHLKGKPQANEIAMMGKATGRYQMHHPLPPFLDL